MTFEFIPDEHNLLDVSVCPQSLDLIPLDLLWTGAILREEHVCNTHQKYYIEPADPDTYLDRFLSFISVIPFFSH